MRKLLCASILLLLSQTYAAPNVVSITVEHEEHILPRYAITEPAWVTELLGPTEFPITTTKKPTLRQTIRETIKQVHSTINGIPDRIETFFENIQKGAQNIIGQSRPRTTTAPPASTTTTPTVAPRGFFASIFF